MMNKKRLYVSDLDGTLLNSDGKLSEFTINTLNRLIEDGLIFSYATARSIVTAEKVTNGLTANFPLIAYNGAFVVDNKSNKIILSNYFTVDEIRSVKSILEKNHISPIVYAFVDGVEKFSFYKGDINKGKQIFLNSRLGDKRRRELDNKEDVYNGNIFYFTCIDDQEKLAQINDMIGKDKRFHCIYHTDIYSGEWWCEIMPKKTSKANAVLQLKALLGCEEIVSFGDGKNDITMFQNSDECYAVENAVPELKEIATGIIESNQKDGVAKWLLYHARRT